VVSAAEVAMVERMSASDAAPLAQSPACVFVEGTD